MPVKLPQLTRLEHQDSPSVGRAKFDLPDTAQAMQKQTQAVEGVLDQGLQYQHKVEVDAADTEAIKRAVEYQTEANKSLDELKKIEGDPTEAYKNHDAEMDNLYERLAGDEKLSPLARDYVMKRVTDAANHVNQRRLSQYGAQYDQYETGVHLASIEMHKNGLYESSTQIIPGKPETMAAFDKGMGDVMNDHIGWAIKRQAAIEAEDGEYIYVDPDGNRKRVNLSPKAKMDMNKDLSEGVSNSMQVAIRAGQIDKANTIKDKYWNVVETRAKGQLADDFEKATIENKSYMLAAHPDKAKELRGDLDEVTWAKVQDGARQISSTRQAQYEQIQNRVDKRNADALGMKILKRAEEGQPYVSFQDLKSDPEAEQLFRKIKDPEKAMKIIAQLDRPKVSNPESMDRAQALVYGDDPKKDVRQMSWVEIEQDLAGLKEEDADAYRKIIRDAKTETDAEQFKKFTYGGIQIKETFMQLNGLDEDGFNRISKDEFDKYRTWRSKFVKILAARGPMKPIEIETLAEEFVADEIAGKTFVDTAKPNKFAGDIKAAAPGTKVASNNLPGISALPNSRPKMTRPQWHAKYLNEKRRVPTNEQLDLFIKQNGG